MRRSLRLCLNLGVIAMAFALSGCSYNKFTTQEEAIKAQWAQVQNELQRRNDLIPNLVETVKGYASHESGVFKDIAEGRELGDATTLRDPAIVQAIKQSADEQLGRTPS